MQFFFLSFYFVLSTNLELLSLSWSKESAFTEIRSYMYKVLHDDNKQLKIEAKTIAFSLRQQVRGWTRHSNSMVELHLLDRMRKQFVRANFLLLQVKGERDREREREEEKEKKRETKFTLRRDPLVLPIHPN